MAKVGITLSFRAGEEVPVLRSRILGSEAKTSSASSQATTMTADSDSFWTIASDGGPIWVTFAAAPTAIVGTGYLVTTGGVVNVEATAGDKAAIIDA